MSKSANDSVRVRHYHACEMQVCDASEGVGAGRIGRVKFSYDILGSDNVNGRGYLTEEYRAEIARLNSDEVGKVFGEVDHPMDDPSWNMCKMSEAAFLVSSIEMKGTKITLVCDVMDNEHGRQLKSVVEVGGRPGISQRASVRAWRDATEAERAERGIPIGEPFKIGVGLRLVTWDAVTNAGFVEADEPLAVEHKEEKNMDAIKNASENDIKTHNPALYAAILALGARSVDLAAATKSAVESALAPVQVELATATKRLKAFEAALTDQTTALIAGGVITGPADAEIARRTATNAAELAAANQKATESATKLKLTEDRLAAVESTLAKAEAMAAAKQTYGAHKGLPLILKAIESATFRTAADGAGIAAAEAARVDLVTKAMESGSTDSNLEDPNATKTTKTTAGESAEAKSQREKAAADREYANSLLNGA